MLKSIDLFAGIGGIRLGFENAFGDELKTVFVSEWDEYAQKTYKANFHDDFEIARRYNENKGNGYSRLRYMSCGIPLSGIQFGRTAQGL